MDGWAVEKIDSVQPGGGCGGGVCSIGAQSPRHGSSEQNVSGLGAARALGHTTKRRSSGQHRAAGTTRWRESARRLHVAYMHASELSAVLHTRYAGRHRAGLKMPQAHRLLKARTRLTHNPFPRLQPTCSPPRLRSALRLRIMSTMHPPTSHHHINIIHHPYHTNTKTQCSPGRTSAPPSRPWTSRPSPRTSATRCR